MSAVPHIGCECRIERAEGGWRAVLVFWPTLPEVRQEFPTKVFADKKECERAARDVGIWLMDNWKRLAETPVAPDGEAATVAAVCAFLRWGNEP